MRWVTSSSAPMMTTEATTSPITPALLTKAETRTLMMLASVTRTMIPRTMGRVSASVSVGRPNHFPMNGAMLTAIAVTDTMWAMTIHQPDCHANHGLRVIRLVTW